MADFEQELVLCCNAFVTLGDENRQVIITTLPEHHSGMRVEEIIAKTNLSRLAGSYHLEVFKDAGSVNSTMNFFHVDANKSQWV